MAAIQRIGSLLCVAGPRASGKTTFVHQLKDRELAVPDGLPPELHQMKGWNSRTHSRLRREERSSFKTLIAHYDFIRGPDQAADRNLMDSLLAAAEHASCVTLWAALDVLIARIDERHRLEDKAQDGIRSEGKPQGDSRTRAIYSDPRLLVARFEAWFAIAAQYPVEHHWIIDTTMPNLRVLPLDAWPELRERMLDTAPA